MSRVQQARGDDGGPGLSEAGSPPEDLAAIRDNVRRNFNLPHWAVLVLPTPAFFLVCLYLAVYATESWRRTAGAIGLLLLVALDVPQRFGTGLHWMGLLARLLYTAGLTALSGGFWSPLFPFFFIAVAASPMVAGRVGGVITASVALSFGLQAAWHDAHTAAATSHLVVVASTCAAIVSTAFVGAWMRNMSDEMLRRSLASRDEVLRMNRERITAMTTFAAEMAHELKNPLATIKGLATLMELDPARAPERQRVLQHEVNRMQETLAEFLNFSRPLTTLSLVDVDLREAVSEVVRLHAGLASEKRVTFETRGVQALTVRADARKIEQMLVNLVQNAIDAVGAGQTVELEALARGDLAQLSVLDRGSGVPPERLGSILEPGVTTKAKGSGLGLTIVRALAEQHGGRLVLANRAGGGFVATIELPGVGLQRQAPALAHAVA